MILFSRIESIGILEMKRGICILFFLIILPSNSYATGLRYALERFHLDELKIYSTTYEEGCGWFAEIVDKNNDIHLLKVGNFIGKNVGKVLKIEQGKIHIREIIRDDSGKWMEQDIIFDVLY